MVAFDPLKQSTQTGQQITNEAFAITSAVTRALDGKHGFVALIVISDLLDGMAEHQQRYALETNSPEVREAAAELNRIVTQFDMWAEKCIAIAKAEADKKMNKPNNSDNS